MAHVLQKIAVILGLALVSALALPGLAVATPPSNQEVLADRILGNPDAPVTIFDFSSLTCPHCADFHTNTLPALKAKYIDTGKVRLIFRDFPLDRFALAASLLARCAAPTHYFGFLDVLFKDQSHWARASDPMKALAQIGALGGVSNADFEACSQNKQLSDAILERQMEAQKKYNVQSTPTFVFNDGADKIEGALPLEKFEAVIDKLLSH